MRKTAKLLPLVAGSIAFAVAPLSAAPSTTVQIAHGSLRASVVMNGLVPMAKRLSRSSGAQPAIQVQLRGDFPTIETSAVPAYGFSSRPGRMMYLTLVTSYRAAGDQESAHPIHQGVPIEPNHSSPLGYADVELPIGEHAALALRITVPRQGYARVAFRHPTDPAKDLLVL